MLQQPISNLHYTHKSMIDTRSSAKNAERPHDASRLSVVSFNDTIPRAQSFIITQAYFCFRFTTTHNYGKCCSVVFGVTVSLPVINTSSSISHEQRTTLLIAMSVTNLPRSGTAVCITLGGHTTVNTRRSQILVENCDFCLPHLHSKPPLGGSPSEYCCNV